MSLDIQIKTILISIVFGMYFSLFLSLNYKIIYHKSELIKLLGTLIIMILNVLLYFYIIKNVNNGVFHIYELLCILIGSVIQILLDRYIIEKYKKR